MRRKLMIESWPVPPALRPKKRQALKLTWWSILALWRSKPLALLALVAFVPIYTTVFSVEILLFFPEFPLVPTVLLCLLSSVVVLGVLYCLTTVQLIRGPRTIVLANDHAVAAAKGKLTEQTEVWTLVNHSVRHQRQGHGAAFRKPLWTILINAQQSGCRCSHSSVPAEWRRPHGRVTVVGLRRGTVL
ncbi:hypothetical protein [Plantibacter sp. CFBP 8804]|uniref:hypothetical protein n=1 Tax=Plantibacter sp. CFBP 8804 TaxID=2775270 RepID=UPI00178484FB|nr:hypothetical protein [Plantibacter sp. CFBP 8804]MBD8519187.1 hypothetical protein [Plantibacter sp. CFBP 8804]